jgi:hypothetical protein
MSRTRILVALLLTFSLVTAPSFAAVKAGAKCTKAGATANAGGKKFTCIKSGTKLVWNKGVAIKAAAPKPSATPEAKNLLASDARIAPAASLTNLEVCKTEDLTPYFIENGVKVFGNGFPRPTFVINGKKTAKVLVIPMVFSDLPFTDKKQERGLSDLEHLNQTIPVVIDTFKNLSVGRFELKIDVLPKSEWWVIDSDNPFSGQWGVPNGPALSKIIEKDKKDFNFGVYDTFAFITGIGRPGQSGLGSAQAARLETKTSKSGIAEAMIMVGTAHQTIWWVHELGHTLFALEDLYLFSLAASRSGIERVDEPSVPTKWDLMADANKPKLLKWNSLLIGWLYDSEVRCINQQKASVHYLSSVDVSNDPKLLTINIATGVTLAAEARPGTTDGSGLLLYTINSHIQQGEGPILAQNSLVSRGQSKSWLGWQFNVLESNKEGILIEAVKTDIDKFVPPPPKPKSDQPPSKTSKINLTNVEILSTGYLKARTTWSVSGHESFRVYVIAADDPQKVFFESGIRNGSQNPIAVEISGLPCNRAFQIMAMFFTEQDGKGDRLVRENKDLGVLSCEDTTKKP